MRKEIIIDNESKQDLKTEISELEHKIKLVNMSKEEVEAELRMIHEKLEKT